MKTEQMNEKQWEIAHDLACELIDNETDRNEFGKVAAFMRRYQRADNAKDMFVSLLQRLANDNNAPIQSNRTPGYYQNIQKSCERYLKDISDSDEMMLILGWCMRLMRYYEVEPKHSAKKQFTVQEQPKKTPKLQPIQPSLLKKEPKKPKVEVGHKVQATILKNDGSKVTVQLQTETKEEIIFERPYFPRQVGAQIKLRVQGVNEKGQVTKVIP